MNTTSLLSFQPKEGYIGMKDRDRENTWIWEDSGRTANYFNWGGNNPNGWVLENCARMYFNGKWDDVVCDLILPFVGDTYTLPVVCEKLLWL